MQAIESGTKLQMAISPEVGRTPDFCYVSTYKDAIDESAFLIAPPLKDGKLFVVDENTKILFKYNMGTEAMIIAAYKDDEVKLGVRRYWKMRRVSEQRQYFQRKDERYKITLHCSYWQETWKPNFDGVIEKEEAMTLDISAGGVAVYMARRFDVGEFCKFSFPQLSNYPSGNAVDGLVGVICWYREAPKGSPFKNVCGLQFRFSDDEDKADFANYIKCLTQVYNL